MSGAQFSWMYKDPALIIDRLIDLRARMEAAEKIDAERHRIRQSRKWRRLVKLAKARKLKGQE